MTRPDTDVLIVGAGPAGCVLGGLLAGDGFPVTIVDRQRHPRTKPCGELLNPGAVKILHELGLGGTLETLSPAHRRGWRMRTPGVPEAVGLYTDSETGRSVARARFDAMLAGWAVRQGATINEGIQVRSATLPVQPWLADPSEHHGEYAGAYPMAHTIEADGTHGRRAARVLIGADGLKSLLARVLDPQRPPPGRRKLSLTAHMRGRLDRADLGIMRVSDEATVGLSPISASGDLWNATVVVDPARFGSEVASDPTAFHRRMVESSQLPWQGGPDLVEGPWTSGPFDRPTRRVTGNGMLLVGDASGYFDPLTGQGVYRALRSAQLAFGVLRVVLRVGEIVPSARQLSPYARRLGRSVLPGRILQRAVEFVVSRGNLRRRAFARLAAYPAAADRLIRVIGDASSPASLAHPEVGAALVGVRRVPDPCLPRSPRGRYGSGRGQAGT